MSQWRHTGGYSPHGVMQSIFFGNFGIMAEYRVLENMDPYPTYLIRVGASCQHKIVNITFDCIEERFSMRGNKSSHYSSLL